MRSVGSPPGTAFRKEAKRVGEPCRIVAPCRPIASTIGSTEKVDSTSTTRLPAAMAALKQVSPKACESGMTKMAASWGVARSTSLQAAAPLTSRAWVTSAPFGAPVVPEV